MWSQMPGPKVITLSHFSLIYQIICRSPLSREFDVWETMWIIFCPKIKYFEEINERNKFSSEPTVFWGENESKKEERENEGETQKELLHPKGGLILNKKNTSFAFANSNKTKSFLK